MSRFGRQALEDGPNSEDMYDCEACMFPTFPRYMHELMDGSMVCENCIELDAETAHLSFDIDDFEAGWE